MRKVNLNNLYESSVPPTDTRVLWVVKNHNTGDIKAIFRYERGKWEPYLVSVRYMKEEVKEEDAKVTNIKNVNNGES